MTNAEPKLSLREIFASFPDRIFTWRTNRPGKPTSRATYFANMRPRRLCTEEGYAAYRRAEDAWRVVWEAERLPAWLERALMARQKGCPAVALAKLRHQAPPPAAAVARWQAAVEIAAAADVLRHVRTCCARRVVEAEALHARRVAKARAMVSRLDGRALRRAA